MLFPETFFSLHRFSHRALWKEGAFVWDPLHHLKSYLNTLSFRIEIPIPKEVTLIEPQTISIGKGTILEPGVCIKGPCVLGEGCAVRHGALLRGGVICGDGCVIGHSAEVKHSILLDGVAATHFTYVGDSILGNEVNLGAGVKCANLRLDRREVVVHCEGRRERTGLRKLGALVGDRSQVGCNCVLNPGTLLGRECLCYPLLDLSGYIPPQSVVKGTAEWKIFPSLARKER